MIEELFEDVMSLIVLVLFCFLSEHTVNSEVSTRAVHKAAHRKGSFSWRVFFANHWLHFDVQKAQSFPEVHLLL